MFRVSVLSIVLTLAMGPDAALLCEFWCVPTADVTEACDHDGAGTARIAAAGDCCTDMVVGTAVPRFQAVRPEASFPDGADAIPVLRDQPDRSLTSIRRGYELGRARSLDHRPLPIILRL
jgi:hypothetical protein